MATREEIFTDLITPLEARLGVFSRGDATAFYNDCCEALSPFPVQAVRAAQRWYRDNWTYGRWPSPAEMRDRCSKVPVLKAVDTEPTEPSKPEYKLDEEQVTRLLDCQLGRDAARGRWIGDLYDHVAEFHELPSRKQVDQMAPRAGRHDAMVSQLERNEINNTRTGEVGSLPPLQRDALLKLGLAMQARDDRVSLAIGVTPPVKTTREAG